jgi:hypothetical protein
MVRNSKQDLLKELEKGRNILGIKALFDYKRNGVVVRVKKANTGFIYDRELILNDGTSVVAWV